MSSRARWHIPYLSLFILVVLFLVYWAELYFPASPAQGLTPSLRTLIALGAVSRELVFDKGEWWRIFTAPLMHGGLEHIVGNSIALFFASRYLEKIAGWRWTAALFVIGALGGVAGSLIMNPPEIVGVGASGAIMALLAALFVLSFDNQVVKNTFRMQRTTLFLLIPSLLPAATGSHIDVSAHLGGAVVGGMMGFFLQMFWSEQHGRPQFEKGGSLAGLAGAGAAALAFLLVAVHLPANRMQVAAIYEPKLMSEADVPSTMTESELHSDELVRRFPDDPRAHAFRALRLLKVDDLTGAQAEIRIALDQRKVLEEVPARFTATLRVLLALTQLRQGRLDDARRTAAPACATASEDDDLSAIMQSLHSNSVCP